MNRWLLPEGIEEILSKQALATESLRRQLLDLFDSWGYDLVIPPAIEFTDSLLTGLGADLDLKTLKVTDQVSGKTMGFRADISPQVARIDARTASEGVNRLCYAGTVFFTKPTDALSSRAPIQIGAELFGVDSVSADLEVIQLMLTSLRLLTDKSLTLDLGHVGFCSWLWKTCEDEGLDAEYLYTLIQSKRLPELEQALSEGSVNDLVRKRLLAMPRLIGGIEVLDEAEQCFDGVEEVLSAITELKSISNSIMKLVPNIELFFDLGEMQGSNYHTGVVFGAFVEHQGVAKRITNGGRYNDVGAVFGNARAATGFSADLKLLVQLQETDLEERYSVYAPVSSEPGFWEQVGALRAHGVRVILGYEEDGANGPELDCQQTLLFDAGEWHLVTQN